MTAMRKIKLTKERKRWVGSRTVVLKSQPLYYNVGVQVKYARAVNRMVKELIAAIETDLKIVFVTRKAKQFFSNDSVELNVSSAAFSALANIEKEFEKKFKEGAKPAVDDMWSQSLKTSEVALRADLKELTGGFLLDTSIIPASLSIKAKAILKDNVDRIVTMPSELLKNVRGAVTRSITNEKGLAYLIPELEKYSTRSLRHTELMALDQTRKAYSQINAERMKSVGVKKFRWIHSYGGRDPREDHIAMDGNIYSFDDLPIIDHNTGEIGLPGDAINCRCTMEPVIEFEDGTTT